MNDLALRELVEEAVSSSQDAGMVLADFLQQNGDPRGELIALEHALQNANGNSNKIRKLRDKLAKKVEQELQAKYPNIKILNHWNGFPTDIIAFPEDYDLFNQSDDAYSGIKVRFARNYDVVPGDTYALAVHELRRILKKENNQEHPRFKLEDGTSVYRPLTLEEDFEARVIDYWTLKNPDGSPRTKEERLKLFYDYQDSCTGIAYQEPVEGEPLKFRVDPKNKDLIMIDKNFNQTYKQINYADYPGKEFEIDKSYNRSLSKSGFLNHDFLRTVVPEMALRTALSGIIYDVCEESPGVYLLGRNEIEEDQLRALCFLHLGDDSSVVGRYGLDGGAHFLRVAQGTP